MAKFAGDQKVGMSILGPLELKFVEKTIHLVPSWLQTYHLTMMTLLWSAGVVVFGRLARENLAWTFGMSAMLVMQYITDLFDGKIGKLRNTGLIKWGYFMDHFLDYIFSCSLVIAYYLMAPPGMTYYFLALLVCSGAFLVNSFLSFAATNNFRIAYYGIGPTEVRLGYIIINTIIFIWKTGIYHFWVPVLLVANVLALCFMIWKTHRILWDLDMQAKAAANPS
ncbi:MAG: hypothetical protein JW709_00435 [Sedimentisphaerales bacterium]|nr:hypothetical protein [Sedimentisphaerales bacterium]